MQARVKQNSRYGSITAFSGIEYVKHEFRSVPKSMEDQARVHDLLEVREGKAEKEVVQKQAKDAIKPIMQARLIASHHDDSLRTLGGKEFVKGEWRPVPDGHEQPARDNELLEVWEAGEEEPVAEKKSKDKKSTDKKSKSIKDDDIKTEGKE